VLKLRSSSEIRVQSPREPIAGGRSAKGCCRAPQPDLRVRSAPAVCSHAHRRLRAGCGPWRAYGTQMRSAADQCGGAPPLEFSGAAIGAPGTGAAGIGAGGAPD
jgi:hypothetical protein